MNNASEKQISYAKSIAQKLGLTLPTDLSYQTVNQFIQKNLDDYRSIQGNEKKQELREKIVTEISIISYAQELGFTVIRKGKYYSLKEHDSVIIDPQKNCYWRNSESGRGSSIGKGGSVIDFAVNFSNNTMHEILSDFTNRVKGVETKRTVGVNANTVKEKGKLELPEKSSAMRNVYAYLIKSRYIDTSVVQDFVNKKMLYQDMKNNCVFVSYDGQEPVFACKRGTNTQKRFLADIENSNYEKGFYIDNHSDKLIVTESVIDAMSVMSILNAKGIDYKDYDFMPLAGAAKFEALKNKLLQKDKKELFLALDNDKGGRENTNFIKEFLEAANIDIEISECFPESKDWNQEIIDTFNKGKAIADIEFFKNVEVTQEVEKKKSENFLQRACNKEIEKAKGIHVGGILAPEKQFDEEMEI